MALIKCPECGKEISNKSNECIHCGCPLQDAVPQVRCTPSFLLEKTMEPKNTIGGTLLIGDVDTYDLVELLDENYCVLMSIQVSRIVGKLTNFRGLVFSSLPADIQKKCQYVIKCNCGCSHHAISSVNITDNLQAVTSVTTNSSNDDNITIKCKRCGSTQIAPKTKGFGLGKAALGGLVMGPVGLLGGVIGSKKMKVVCLKCGYEWEAGKN